MTMMVMMIDTDTVKLVMAIAATMAVMVQYSARTMAVLHGFDGCEHIITSIARYCNS